MTRTYHIKPIGKVGGSRKGRSSKKDRAKNKSDRIRDW